MLKPVLAVLALITALGLVTIVGCAGSSTQTKPTTLGDGGSVQITPDPNATPESQPSK
jgi:hypothetical protein